MKVSERGKRYVLPAIVILIAVAVGVFFSNLSLQSGVVLLGLPFLVLFLVFAFRSPVWVMYAVIIMGFLIPLLSRYLPGDIPFGLSIDGLLVLLILILIFDKRQGFIKSYFTNALVLALFVWLVFSFLELFNPLARSRIAWFYANRGLSFYPFLIAFLSLYVFNKKEYLHRFLIIWALFSVLGTLWGLKQLLVGVSDVEQAWLNAGAASTHVLFGKLRVFSYYSDAAQFGANQAHTSVVFGIIGLYTRKMKFRWIYLTVAALTLYGMLISGTRGAIGILALGGLTYFIMTKNWRVISIGFLAAAGVFIFLKYTTLLQSNYQVNRLRTALRGTDDPSFRVRKEREARLKNYLADKPFGEGIGSAGFWGRRFNPGTFLAEIGTDGHYTRIWMETGIVGLMLYLTMLLVIIFYLGGLLWNMEESFTRQVLVAFLSGFAGLCLSSYTNGLLIQIPTGVLTFTSLALIYKFSSKK